MYFIVTNDLFGKVILTEKNIGDLAELGYKKIQNLDNSEFNKMIKDFKNEGIAVYIRNAKVKGIRRARRKRKKII